MLSCPGIRETPTNERRGPARGASPDCISHERTIESARNERAKFEVDPFKQPYILFVVADHLGNSLLVALHTVKPKIVVRLDLLADLQILTKVV